mmetsp:Transcript_24223/g.57706  ORF Transcript_24223/g.57706 Transcript_24223/m.57706 type:complete len:201 (-) Transcript_24223:1557-2159(-)
MKSAACCRISTVLPGTANRTTAGTIPIMLTCSRVAVSLLTRVLTSSRVAITTLVLPESSSSMAATMPEFVTKQAFLSADSGRSPASCWQAPITLPSPSEPDSRLSRAMSRLASSFSCRLSATLSWSFSMALSPFLAAGLRPTAPRGEWPPPSASANAKLPTGRGPLGVRSVAPRSAEPNGPESASESRSVAMGLSTASLF